MHGNFKRCTNKCPKEVGMCSLISRIAVGKYDPLHCVFAVTSGSAGSRHKHTWVRQISTVSDPDSSLFSCRP